MNLVNSAIDICEPKMKEWPLGLAANIKDDFHRKVPLYGIKENCYTSSWYLLRDKLQTNVDTEEKKPKFLTHDLLITMSGLLCCARTSARSGG